MEIELRPVVLLLRNAEVKGRTKANPKMPGDERTLEAYPWLAPRPGKNTISPNTSPPPRNWRYFERLSKSLLVLA
jgi:hypothetical protein